MACQAIIRRHYEKAVNIFNTMAHAPFQVSFQEWIEFFERNRDRLDQATLIELQKELVSHETGKELTVLNLSRVLEFICRSCEDSVNSTASISARMEKVPEDSPNVRFDGTLKLTISRVNPTNTVHDYQSSSSRMDTDRDSDEASSTSKYCDEKDLVRAHPARLAVNFDRDLASRSWTYNCDDTGTEGGEWDSESDEFNTELIIPSSGVDDSKESDTPSAYEILEIWKKK